LESLNTRTELMQHIAVITDILNNSEFTELIDTVARESVDTIFNNRKILLVGNGGSAADCQHIAGELVSRFYFDRPAMPAIALTTDTSILTAIGNDLGYNQVFSRQIEALGRAGDMLWAYSTSGNSANILAAINTARDLGMSVVGFTGNRGGAMDSLCHRLFAVPHSSTPRIQEAHAVIGHIVCAHIEQQLYGH
jgi:D-sedoheptulose 7-phosphate isomerase